MKKNLLALLLMTLLPTVASAVTVNGFNYTLNKTNKTASVTSGDYSGDISIPTRFEYEKITYTVTSISASAFKNCSSLTSINIPDGVTNIGDRAFEDCSQLQTASISNSSKLKSIGDYAFSGCSSLTSINIPDGVTSIGYKAFYNCSSLESINIPDGVTSIRGNTFYGCSLLQTASISNSSKLESIGPEAFLNCSSLESINIPDGVTSIGYYAFRYCSQLQTASISNSSKLESIGSSAFSGCSSLTSINIPDGVTSIGEGAFGGCSSLTSINIPNGITNIDRWVFIGCKNLPSIYIPDGVTSIEEGTFSGCTQLQTVNISETSNLTTIGREAFYQCSSLESFLIPAKVETVGLSAFDGCSNISKLSFYCKNISRWFNPSKVEEIMIGDSVKSIGREAFRYFSSLIRIKYEDKPSLKEIGASAFSKCSSLVSINIPDSVTSIGASAFSSCGSLVSINIPDGVTSIEEKTFISCSSLASIYIPDSVISINLRAFSDCTQLRTVGFSNKSKLESIGNNSFENCSSLVSISIPDSVTSIGSEAFQDCYQLKVVNISKNSNLKRIGTSAFGSCSSLESFLIPAKMETVGLGPFSRCTNISKLSFYCKNVNGSWFEASSKKVESILIGNSVETIIESSFKNFISLKTLTFEGSSSLKEIGSGAFSGCDALKEVVLPEPLETIGSGAFSSCDALETIKLPKTLKVINNSAFYYCYALKDVYAYMPKPFGINESVFSTTAYKNAVLHVNGVADKYRKRFAWSKFFHIINIGETPGEGDGGIDSENSGDNGNSGAGLYTTQNYYYDLTAQGNGEIVVDEYITQMDLGMGASWTQYFEGVTVRDEQKVVEIPHFPGTGVPFKFIPDNGYHVKQVLFTPENNGTPQDVTNDLVYDSSISGYTYQAVDQDSYPKLVVIFEEGTPVPSDAVTLTAKNYSRVYGESNPAFEFTVSNGTVTSGTPTISCSATTTSPVGTYPITITKGSVTNTSVTCVNGTLTITKAPLTIKAGNYTKVEGEDNPEFTLTYEGFKNDETAVVLTKQPTVSCSASKDSPAGSYPVTVSGAEAQNYEISYVSGTLNVTEAGSVNPDDIITFADAKVKAICVENWDTNNDGELSKAEAAAVTDLGTLFRGKHIGSFEEIKYFTGVTSLVDEAFYWNTSLGSFTVPAFITNIGKRVFAENYINNLSVEAGNPVYDSRDNCNAIVETATNKLIAACDKSFIPASVTAIGEGAFSGCLGLTDFDIPITVSSIEAEAFHDCRRLESVTVHHTTPLAIDEDCFTWWDQDNGVYQKPRATLYVPAGTKSLYRQADGWKDFSDIVETGVVEKYDLTGDGEVNGTDLVVLVEAIMSESANASADLNGDGETNGTDLVILVEIIMSVEPSANNAAARGDATASLTRIEVEAEPYATDESRTLDILLSNPDMDVTMVQMDMHLPNGLTLNTDDHNVEMAERTSWRSHSIYTRSLDNNTVRLMLASNRNVLIDGTGGALLRLHLTADPAFEGGDITFDNMLCTSPSLEEARPTATTIRLAASGTTGIRTDRDAGLTDDEWYNMQGLRVKKPGKGLYIRNGRKVVIK